MKTRIALLEDHVLVRRAVATLLEHKGELEVVAEVGTAREMLLCEMEFELLITGLNLPGPSGFTAIVEARRRWPKRRILVLTMYIDPFRAAEALAAGADGYAVKNDDEAALLEAVRLVQAGERYLSPRLDHDAVLQLLGNRRARVLAAGPLAPLSMREREVFDLLVRGYSCQQIAELLFISPRTADTHRTHIFGKLGVHSVAALVRFGARFNLIGECAAS